MLPCAECCSLKQRACIQNMLPHDLVSIFGIWKAEYSALGLNLNCGRAICEIRSQIAADLPHTRTHSFRDCLEPGQPLGQLSLEAQTVHGPFDMGGTSKTPPYYNTLRK